jgi:hypothetical protein
MHPWWFTWIRNLAALLLILCWLTVVLFQRSYIINRYEQETPLSKLRFFQNPLLLTFKPGLQRSLKRFIYTMHVFLARVLPSLWLKGLRSFSDVGERDEILRHFSRREVAIAVIAGTMAVLGMLLAVAAVAIRPFI